jgi:hypothetical protein
VDSIRTGNWTVGDLVIVPTMRTPGIIIASKRAFGSNTPYGSGCLVHYILFSDCVVRGPYFGNMLQKPNGAHTQPQG